MKTHPLKLLRKKWRTEATRLRKWSNDKEASKSFTDRAWYEMNIYEACANDLDTYISKMDRPHA